MYIQYRTYDSYPAYYVKENLTLTKSINDAYNFSEILAKAIVEEFNSDEELDGDSLYFIVEQLPSEYIPIHGEKFTCNNLPGVTCMCIDKEFMSSQMTFQNLNGSLEHKDSPLYKCFGINLDNGKWLAFTNEDNDILCPLTSNDKL